MAFERVQMLVIRKDFKAVRINTSIELKEIMFKKSKADMTTREI